MDELIKDIKAPRNTAGSKDLNCSKVILPATILEISNFFS